MEILLATGAGILISWITSVCKKWNADPRTALYCFAIIAATLYVAFTTFVPGEIATQISTFVLTMLGVAAMVYNFFLKQK